MDKNRIQEQLNKLHNRPTKYARALYKNGELIEIYGFSVRKTNQVLMENWYNRDRESVLKHIENVDTCEAEFKSRQLVITTENGDKFVYRYGPTQRSAICEGLV